MIVGVPGQFRLDDLANCSSIANLHWIMAISWRRFLASQAAFPEQREHLHGLWCQPNLFLT